MTRRSLCCFILFFVATIAAGAEHAAGADQAPPLESEDFAVVDTRREDTRIRFLTADGKTVIDINSGVGIDKATIKRKTREWPKSMVVRLHLRGLESFKASAAGATVQWSVSSTGNHGTRVSLRAGTKQTSLDTKSPFYSKVTIVGGNGKIPLRNGHFEVPLPAKLFAENPESITLSWIDFYRS